MNHHYSSNTHHEVYRPGSDGIKRVYEIRSAIGRIFHKRILGVKPEWFDAKVTSHLEEIGRKGGREFLDLVASAKDVGTYIEQPTREQMQAKREAFEAILKKLLDPTTLTLYYAERARARAVARVKQEVDRTWAEHQPV